MLVYFVFVEIDGNTVEGYAGLGRRHATPRHIIKQNETKRENDRSRSASVRLTIVRRRMGAERDGVVRRARGREGDCV